MTRRSYRYGAIWCLAGTVLSLWLGAVWPSTALADAAAGRAAYEHGDYARALADWQSAADKGDPDAQFGMGSLYEYGLAGLPQDYKQADHWYQLSAAQDYGEAAYRLALIWAVGNPDFPPDLVEAYKWVTLAADAKGIWGTLAQELRARLDQVVTPAQQAEGRQRAASWHDTHSAQKQQAAAAPPPAASDPVKPGGCPGWPFPTLPCTEQFPALPGMSPPQAATPFASAAPPPDPAAPGPPPGPSAGAVFPPPSDTAPPVPSPDAKTQLDALNEALGRIDCASLIARAGVPGEGPHLSGTIPEGEAKTQLATLAGRYFPDKRPQLDVVVIPPPLCRSVAALATLRRQGLVTDSDLRVRLVGGNGLREGDPIEVEVRAPAWAVSLRIDYFSLDGQVQHLWPNDQEPEAKLATGAVHVFGDAAAGKVWRAGGAPFGTEEIAVIATPLPLKLGGARPAAETGVDYLRDVAAALAATHAANTPNLATTILVSTRGR